MGTAEKLRSTVSTWCRERKGQNVSERFQVLRRLAGRNRHPPPQVVRHRQSSQHLRSEHEGSPPKNEGERTLAQILLAEVGPRKPNNTNSHAIRAARLIVASAGSLTPEELHAAHIQDIDAAICGSGYSHATRFNTAAAAVRILKRLERYHSAPALSQLISHHPGLRPRNITATDDERQSILAAAPPHLRLFALLCSDLAIRSGTAVRLAPEHYDNTHALLRFTTKLGERLTLPVTDEIRGLIAQCDLNHNEPFIRQLHATQPQANLISTRPDRYQHTIGSAFRALCHKLGITRKLTPHDFRRTAAVRMYQETGDARDVQALLGHRSLASTVWYLDHDLRPVKRSILEIIKRPDWRKEMTA